MRVSGVEGLGAQGLGFGVLGFRGLGFRVSLSTKPLPKALLAVANPATSNIWVVVKIMVSFWVPNIIRHLIFRVPKKGPLF